MTKCVTRIRTSDGDLPIDYNALEHLPKADATLTASGSFADAKAAGDAISQLSATLNGTSSQLAETKTMAENAMISIDTLKKITSLLGSSSDSALDISSNDGAYRITIDNDGISFWYYTTKVAYIKNDTLHGVNTKVEYSFSLADLVATVSDDGYIVWS